jgi:S-adenosyl-L-methionine hydrolase (adenosine-forming)
VLVAATPGVTIIDLTHQIPAFDVRAGSHTLVRAMPHLGQGVVLAVVDPGVGSARRGLCIEVTLPGGDPSFFVGPDNGLLIAAAESAGEAPVSRAFGLRRDRDLGTFDGRDLFAPAAAALCRGVPPEDLGEPVDPQSLVRITGGVVEQGRLRNGRSCMRAEVMWVDRFGNLQLAATFADAQAAGVPATGTVDIAVVDPLSPAVVEAGRPLRRVGTFADLAHGELGLLIDSNGHVAVVAGEASAASQLNVSAGALVVLAW